MLTIHVLFSSLLTNTTKTNHSYYRDNNNTTTLMNLFHRIPKSNLPEYSKIQNQRCIRHNYKSQQHKMAGRHIVSFTDGEIVVRQSHYIPPSLGPKGGRKLVTKPNPNQLSLLSFSLLYILDPQVIINILLWTNHQQHITT